jgi:hypothetical protein
MTRELPAIKDRKTANQLLELCEQGKAYCIKTILKDKSVLTVCAKSGREIAVVGQRYEYEFKQFFTAHGAGDGLFPGFDQTTRR